MFLALDLRTEEACLIDNFANILIKNCLKTLFILLCLNMLKV